jgi:hypothetical protein
MRVENITRKALVDAIAKIDPLLRRKIATDELSPDKYQKITETISIFIETLMDSIVEIIEGKDIETFLDLEDDELEDDDSLDEIVFDDAA